MFAYPAWELKNRVLAVSLVIILVLVAVLTTMWVGGRSGQCRGRRWSRHSGQAHWAAGRHGTGRTGRGG